MKDLMEKVDLAIKASGGEEFNKKRCYCDSSVGYVIEYAPCEYYAIRNALFAMKGYLKNQSLLITESNDKEGIIGILSRIFTLISESTEIPFCNIELEDIEREKTGYKSLHLNIKWLPNNKKEKKKEIMIKKERYLDF